MMCVCIGTHDVFDVNGVSPLNRMVYAHTMVSISYLSLTCGSREKGVGVRCDVVVHTSDKARVLRG